MSRFNLGPCLSKMPLRQATPIVLVLLLLWICILDYAHCLSPNSQALVLPRRLALSPSRLARSGP